MKILVTGATGKVGSRLARRLARRGDHVRALVRDRARATDLGSIELVEVDLLDAASLATAVRGAPVYRRLADAISAGALVEPASA